MEETKYRCGLDWSERQHNRRMIRLCALVGISDVALMTAVFQQTRQRLGYPKTYEFHGQMCPEETQFQLLSAIWEAEVGMRFAAVIRDESSEMAPKSASGVMTEMGIATLALLIPTARMAEIAADEDLKGHRQQKPFITEAKRMYREHWPGDKCKIHFCPSDRSDLVQLADLVVYGVGRLRLGLVRHEKLRALLEGFVVDVGNLIVEQRGEE